MSFPQYPGYPGGRQPPHDPIITELRKAVDNLSAGLRRLQSDASARFSELQQALSATQVQRQQGSTYQHPSSVIWERMREGGVVRIEDIPGRRIPFDLLVSINIGAGVNTPQTGTITISMDGPFVAVKRYAAFQSSYQYEVPTGTSYSGRSFGRFRPISSVCDVYDAQSNSILTTRNLPAADAFMNAGPAFTSAASNFRTMEWDGFVEVQSQGSGWPRQNQQVPSSLWMDDINTPQQLAALDFLERGDVLQFRVTPAHINNPSFGNANGTSIIGTAGYPFLAGQFDQHEGVVTPNGLYVTGGVVTQLTGTTDSVTRLPDGILIIGLQGYKIAQVTAPLGG